MFSFKASVLKLISTEPSPLDLGSTLALLQVTPVTHVKAGVRLGERIKGERPYLKRIRREEVTRCVMDMTSCFSRNAGRSGCYNWGGCRLQPDTTWTQSSL